MMNHPLHIITGIFHADLDFRMLPLVDTKNFICKTRSHFIYIHKVQKHLSIMIKLLNKLFSLSS